MSRPRKQICSRRDCQTMVRHGWVRGRSFYCSLACLTGRHA